MSVWNCPHVNFTLPIVFADGFQQRKDTGENPFKKAYFQPNLKCLPPAGLSVDTLQDCKKQGMAECGRQRKQKRKSCFFLLN